MGDEIKLGKICATCKHSRFSTSTSQYTSKKMGGLCLLHAEGPCVETPSFVGSETLYRQFMAGCPPTEEEFLVTAMGNYWAYSKEKMGPIVREFYHKTKASFEWWRDNLDKTRKTHRSCTCDCYEEGAGRREQGARTIVKRQGEG